jgi:hypothetical protein
MFILSRRGKPGAGASLRQHYLDQVQRVICTAKLSAGGLWATGSPHRITIAAAGAGVKAARWRIAAFPNHEPRFGERGRLDRIRRRLADGPSCSRGAHAPSHVAVGALADRFHTRVFPGARPSRSPPSASRRRNPSTTPAINGSAIRNRRERQDDRIYRMKPGWPGFGLSFLNPVHPVHPVNSYPCHPRIAAFPNHEPRFGERGRLDRIRRRLADGPSCSRGAHAPSHVAVGALADRFHTRVFPGARPSRSPPSASRRRNPSTTPAINGSAIRNRRERQDDRIYRMKPGWPGFGLSFLNPVHPVHPVNSYPCHPRNPWCHPFGCGGPRCDLSRRSSKPRRTPVRLQTSTGRALPSQRGCVAAIYDAIPARPSKSPQSQFWKKQDVKKVRNS